LHIYGAVDALQVKPEINRQDVLQEASRLARKQPQVKRLLNKVAPNVLNKRLPKSIPDAQKNKAAEAIRGLLGL